MQEMLLQSWDNRLRVFPAVGAEWPDIQFDQLRGEGAYLVSARREAGKTQWTFVKAEARGAIEVDPAIADADLITSLGVMVNKTKDGIYQLATQPGDWVLFWPKGKPQPEPRISAVPRRGEIHRFGLPEEDPGKKPSNPQ